MTKKLPLFPSLTICLTQTTALCNLYLFFASAKGDTMVYLELWPWLLCTLASFFALYFFLWQTRPMQHFIVLGAVCFVATAAVMSLWFTYAVGVLSWLMAWAFYAISVACICAVHLGAFNAQTLLLCCELPAVGIGFLMLFVESELSTFPSYFVGVSLVVLLLSFFALTINKLDTRADAQDGKKGAALTTTLGCFAGMGVLSAAFVAFASAGAAQTVNKTAQLLTALFSAIFRALNAFLNWLFGLFPAWQSELPDTEMESISITQGDTSGMVDYSAAALIMLVILIVLAAAALVWLFIQCKGTRLSSRTQSIAYHRPRIARKKASLWQKLWAAFIQKYRTFLLTVQVLRHRNTPRGAAILLSWRGAKHGCSKQPAESYAAYLARLADICSATDPAAATALAQLSDIVSRDLYAAPYGAAMQKQRYPENLTPKQHRQLRRSVARCKAR